MTVFTFLSLHLHRIATRHISIPILGLPKVERLPKSVFSCTKSKNLLIFHHFFLEMLFSARNEFADFSVVELARSDFCGEKACKTPNQTSMQYSSAQFAQELGDFDDKVNFLALKYFYFSLSTTAIQAFQLTRRLLNVYYELTLVHKTPVLYYTTHRRR